MKAMTIGGFLAVIKKFAQLAAMVGLVATTLTAAASGATPYFKTYGADVFTGGWIDDESDSCNGDLTNYQKPGASAFTGGIDTVTKTSGGTGAPGGGGSSLYGVFSVGEIAGTYGSGYGFYSAGAAGPSRSTTLSFANIADPFGGTFEGAGAPNQGNCIPDYYSTKKLVSAIPFDAASKPNPTNATGQWWYQTATGSPLDLLNADATIPTGNKLTIFVNGDVYLDGNIRYGGGATDANVQKFALVVKGNIYVDPSVVQLDGLYIAQPDLTLANPASDNTGVFWTCHPNNNDATLLSNYPATCSSKLIVNGAVIAKQVKLIRTAGDIGSASVSEAAVASPAAEVFNYTPQMFVGGPFFNPVPPSSSKIQSLISLPPVF